MSSIDHLHAETKVLRVEDHLNLLCSQSLAKTMQPSHPSHSTVTSPSGPRNLIKTLQSRYLPTVEPYLLEGSLPPQNYTLTIKSLHTQAVASAITSYSPNRILQSPSPPIAEEEVTLPRPYRTTLAQLRSGFCSALADFRERVGLTTDPHCPSCGTEPQNVQHLFSCTEHSTSLSPVDLWDRPGLVSNFISNLPFFNLPPLPPSPPEPPPTS